MRSGELGRYCTGLARRALALRDQSRSYSPPPNASHASTASRRHGQRSARLLRDHSALLLGLLEGHVLGRLAGLAEVDDDPDLCALPLGELAAELVELDPDLAAVAFLEGELLLAERADLLLRLLGGRHRLSREGVDVAGASNLEAVEYHVQHAADRAQDRAADGGDVGGSEGVGSAPGADDGRRGRERVAQQDVEPALVAARKRAAAEGTVLGTELRMERA